ncbi:MAG: cytochrome c oxidase accessory protein CcoG [Bacteroidales bacterium]|nr:cytochrome c oxidase accessory protein CcoG [Bacteroidales bacterium]
MIESEQASTAEEKTFFRDRISTINEEGKRRWIYPKRPKGRLTNFRWLVAGFLLTFFFAGPWISYKGEPFMLFNFFERKFILFGQIFWPQDFHLIVLSIITFIVFIILFTVIFGRLFCGWACPQTIFMEFVFRQIEYLIEGDFSKQKKLARMPWNVEKVSKKTLKHIIFYGIAFLVANTFLSYIVGIDQLKELISEGPSANMGTLVALMIFSGAFYFIFAFFREQVCILVCPYGRLQGTLLDSRTIVVAYDYKRGEPKGKHNPLEDRSSSGKGDCIDCRSCVTVCPTGIDIRNGTQLECINCTACIDACNAIMDKVKLKRGLIRYDAEKGISDGNRKIFNARSIAYSVALTVLLIVVGSLFSFRSLVEVTIIRMPGTMFQEYGPNHFSNIYKVQMVNKTREDLPIEIKLLAPEGEIKFVTGDIFLKKETMGEANFMVILPAQQLNSSNTPVEFGIFSLDQPITRYKLNFVGPNSLDK